MKLNVRAMAITMGVFWGGAVLGMEVVNLVSPKYGSGFLRLIASMYPGYKGRRTGKQVALGAAYAVADGASSGLLFALLYNRLAQPGKHAEAEEEDRALLRSAS
jgi:hypothetical protein